MPGSTFAWLFLSRLSSFSSQEGMCFILSSLDDQMIVECKTIPNQKKKKNLNLKIQQVWSWICVSAKAKGKMEDVRPQARGQRATLPLAIYLEDSNGSINISYI